MNIEKELKKNGITVIDKLDTLSINTLAKNIAQKLCRAFPNQRFIAPKLFIAISRSLIFPVIFIATLPFVFDKNGIFLAIPMAEAVTFIIAIILFKKKSK